MKSLKSVLFTKLTSLFTFINNYCANKPRLALYSGIAFITKENSIVYSKNLFAKCNNDIVFFNQKVNSIVICKIVQLILSSIFVVVCCLVVASSENISIASYIFRVLGCFLLLMVIYLIPSHMNVQNFIAASKDVINSYKQKLQDKARITEIIKESQKPIYVIVYGEQIKFQVKEILNIEYFIRLASIDSVNTIPFEKKNIKVIGKKLIEKWGLNKKSTISKHLKKGDGTAYAFLIYDLKGQNKDSNYKKIKNVSNYLIENGHVNASKQLLQYYKIE